METKTYKHGLGYHRDLWPAGPWDNEPDKMQWPDAATGLPCLAVRNAVGAWCGYVGVPPGHAYHGMHYDDVNCSVHGGLTFADACQPTADESADICHVPSPGEPHNVWWLGFDCGHCMDVAPSMLIRMSVLGLPGYEQTYRTLDYVRNECAGLAAQLINARATDESGNT
jgi:hypothetical protein